VDVSGISLLDISGITTVATRIPLTLELKESYMNNRKLLEIYTKTKLRALMQSGYLEEKWTSNWNSNFAKQSFDNEIEQIKAYRQKYDDVLGGSIVSYKKSGHNWGRVYLEGSLGFTSLRRQVRNTLVVDDYYDFDLCNNRNYLILKQPHCLMN
jgi:hypothetical protein